MPEGEGKRKRARVKLVEVLIGAVRAGGGRLSRVRSEFEGMDAADGLKRLVLQAVDPELLAAVVGPRLAPVWVDPLRAQYARFKQAYPADWVDVEKVWREQRARWRRPQGAGGSSSASAGAPVRSRGYPERAVDSVRAGAPRGGRRAVPAVRAAGPAPKAPPAHRPVPAGVAPAHDTDVEPVAAPPDEVLLGAAAADAADEVAQQARERDRAAESASADRRPPVVDPAAPGGAAALGPVNGVAVPPAAPRPAAAADSARDGAAPSDDARIVLSGGAGALVERLLRAMADSRAQVESVRRVWIEADGLIGGWDLWALDPAVIARVRELQRGVER